MALTTVYLIAFSEKVITALSFAWKFFDSIVSQAGDAAC